MSEPQTIRAQDDRGGWTRAEIGLASDQRTTDQAESPPALSLFRGTALGRNAATADSRRRPCGACPTERRNHAEKHFGPSARVRKAIGVEVLCPGQVPALIAKFESTGTPVPLQCHPEVVRPNDPAELPG